MNDAARQSEASFETYDTAIHALVAGKSAWAQTSTVERIAVLNAVKDALMPVASEWVCIAGLNKGLPAHSPLHGEEWLTGPYGVIAACNGFIETLSQMTDKAFVSGLPTRRTTTGQLAVRVVPNDIWDRILNSGVRAEVWMLPGVTEANLKQHTASGYDIAPEQRGGAVSLVLGAGNLAAIAPLDCLQKLFVENEVVVLKLNPVNAYLSDVFNSALRPLIDRDALRIVQGDGAVGDYLCNHRDIDSIHITGSGNTHDLIVWGAGDEGSANKVAGTPKNSRPITSELGAVCPTIVVPGPWTTADITFQAENIATQKLHNSGFNCVACQTLILPEGWTSTDALLEAVKHTMARVERPPYYPGTEDRLAAFVAEAGGAEQVPRAGLPSIPVARIADTDSSAHLTAEVFGPALSTKLIDGTDPEAYLRAAVTWASQSLFGTLAANIIIHPATLREIGKVRLDEIIAVFRYGCIGINAWSGVGFGLTKTPWGAFPGHRLDDVQSGIGVVHNTYMFDRPERTVIEAPFRPFPRSVLSRNPTLMPRPPWFVTNTRQHKTGELLTQFYHRPSWTKLPRLVWNALLG